MLEQEENTENATTSPSSTPSHLPPAAENEQASPGMPKEDSPYVRYRYTWAPDGKTVIGRERVTDTKEASTSTFIRPDVSVDDDKAPCTPPRRPPTPPPSSPAQESSPLMTVHLSKARPRKNSPRLTMTRWWPMAEKDKQLYRQSHPDFVFPIVDKPWKANHSLATVEKVLEEQKQWRKKRSSNARHDNDPDEDPDALHYVRLYSH